MQIKQAAKMHICSLLGGSTPLESPLESPLCSMCMCMCLNDQLLFLYSSVCSHWPQSLASEWRPILPLHHLDASLRAKRVHPAIQRLLPRVPAGGRVRGWDVPVTHSPHYHHFHQHCKRFSAERHSARSRALHKLWLLCVSKHVNWRRKLKCHHLPNHGRIQ